MNEYMISFMRRGIPQANLIVAPDKATAEEYYRTIAPDAEICGLSEYFTRKPGMPVVTVPEGWMPPFVYIVRCYIQQPEYTDRYGDQASETGYLYKTYACLSLAEAAVKMLKAEEDGELNNWVWERWTVER